MQILEFIKSHFPAHWIMGFWNFLSSLDYQHSAQNINLPAVQRQRHTGPSLFLKGLSLIHKKLRLKDHLPSLTGGASTPAAPGA